MGRAKSALVGLAGVASLVAIVRPILGALRQDTQDDIGRWRALTIDRPIAEISPAGQLPPPLAALGSDVEVDIRMASGTRGTHVAVRWVGPKKTADGEDPRVVIRRALTEVKELAEVGDALQPQPRPNAEEPAASSGSMADRAETNADKGAVL